MKKTALIIIFLTIMSKLLGFMREVTLSYLYGASTVSDAYIISMTIPNIIFGFVTSALSAGYIPMYSKIVQDNGEKKAKNFTSNLLNLLLIICTIISLIVVLFAEQLVGIFASGFDKETLMLTVRFTRFSILAIYFLGSISVLNGYLQVQGNYIVPALIGFPLNILIIITMILSKNINIILLAVGYVLASASQLILIIPSLKKNNYVHEMRFDFKDKNLISLISIIVPIVLGMSVNQINILIDRTIASRIAIGGVSVLNYASILVGFIQGVFVLPIITVVYPLLSKMSAEKNFNGVKMLLAKAIDSVNLLVVPPMIGAIIFAKPIVSILFGRGAFDNEAVELTSCALFYYSIGTVGFALRDLLSRVFYAMQETKTATVNATIGMVLNIILNIVLSHYMGIGGLALATSISAVFTNFLLGVSLRKKMGPFGLHQMCLSFVKILLVSSCIGGVSKLLFNCLSLKISQYVAFFIAIFVSFLLFVLYVSLTKRYILKSFVKKIKKQKNNGDF